MKHTRKSNMADIPCLTQPDSKTAGRFGKAHASFREGYAIDLFAKVKGKRLRLMISPECAKAMINDQNTEPMRVNDMIVPRYNFDGKRFTEVPPVYTSGV